LKGNLEKTVHSQNFDPSEIFFDEILEKTENE